MKLVKLVGIIRANDEYIIYPICLTVMGVGIACDPYMRVNINDSKENIAKCIFIGFEKIKFDLPHPQQQEWKEFQDNYLKNLNFKSAKQLHTVAKYCSVKFEDNTLTFKPTINNLSKKSFSPLSSEEINIAANADANEIAETLEHTFDKCE